MAFGTILAKNPKPADEDKQGAKTGWATKFARGIAMELSEEFRQRGAATCQPDPQTGKGSERRFAGGIGAKQVDVSLASDEFGLAMAVSMKGIYFPDATALNAKAGNWNFAKNLMNRKGDMIAEAVTLHKRFPYAVVGAIFLFDERAAIEKVEGKSTYLRAHDNFAAFTGRASHADADEKFEGFALGLIGKDRLHLHWAGNPKQEITISEFVDKLLALVAQRNADHYAFANGKLVKL